MGFISEFKIFAMKGNVVDMAVGIIIGGAFGKIVSSMVNDIIMPIVSVLTGGVSFNDMKYTIAEAINENGAVVKEAVTLNYGAFIQTAVDFTIIAFVIFMMIKAMNNLKKKEEAAPAAPPAPTKDQELLSEIRDLLKK